MKKEKVKKPVGIHVWFARLVYCIILASMMLGLISNMFTIHEKEQELSSVQQMLSSQKQTNDELVRLLESDEDEINERIARDMYGYAAPNERVFVDMSGK